MQFLNRLTGSVTKELPNELLLGQWQVLTESEVVFLNNFELSPSSREYIFPDSAHRWSLHSTDRTVQQERHFPRWQLPSELVSESIRFFERRRRELLSREAFWTDWVAVPPLVPEIKQKILVQPLEKKTHQEFGHLQEVCHRPRTYLKTESERLPVSRAQRLSPDATEFLAAHTEDWERLTIRSVLPKRVLCMVREELRDIYENKVTARLIDNLLDYLRKRIEEVRILKQELDEADYFFGQTHEIHWRNRTRICTLWGHHFDAEAGVREADETLRELKQLQYKLRGLLDTVLYQSIPRRASVGTTLKRTNILINDQHYRHVDLLWREWSCWQSGLIKNSFQVFQENQDLFRGFESFCLLLIGRALTGSGSDDDKGLDFESVTNEIPTRGCHSIRFRGPLGEVSLNWQEDGSFLLCAEDGIADLRFIPLMASLTATTDSKVIDTLLDKTLASTGNQVQFPQIAILYPGTEEERKKLQADLQRKMSTLGNDLLQGEWTKALLPVSPLEIISVERVARAIQWWLSGQRYQSYPPIRQINIPDTLLEDVGWLERDEKPNHVRLLRVPRLEEEQVFRSRLEKLINKAKALGHAGRSTFLSLQELEHLPSKAQKLIQPLCVCPTCRRLGSFNPLDSKCFSAKCESRDCGSSWGTRTCGSCGKKYPFIQIQGLARELKTRQPGWVDRTLGRDVLAIPCWMENNQGTFICSSCGACSQVEQASSGACLRCNHRSRLS